jgi:uncharacterized RDD family membrane protein YckC
MKCAYCRAANDPGEERCVRCGRRLHAASPRPAPESYQKGPESYQTGPESYQMGAAALAPALESLPGGVPLPLKPPQTPEYQPSLFRDSAGPKVVPIPTLTPFRPPHQTQVRTHTARRAAPRSPGVRQTRRVSNSQTGVLQQTLGFAEPSAEVRERSGEAIFCDAMVALPLQRVLAAAVDASLVTMGVGIFLAIFFLCGGEMSLNRQMLPLLLGVAAVFALFYRALWCLANGDSPGMRFAGLRLVDFDGRRPDRDQRILRQVAGLLSLLSAGLGLVWALVDEESLTWHDHISKTFPTIV